jgi:hypothetical protein
VVDKVNDRSHRRMDPESGPSLWFYVGIFLILLLVALVLCHG